jgi:hypothetical protein
MASKDLLNLCNGGWQEQTFVTTLYSSKTEKNTQKRTEE